MKTEAWFNKQISTDTFYNDIEDVLGKFKGPVSIPEFFSLLSNKVIQRNVEYSAIPVQNECSVAYSTNYGPCNMETIMLMLGLMALSWFQFNIKRKTENGDCRNPAHEPVTETKPANCIIGSKFHSILYNDFITILEDFLIKVKNSNPTPIKSTNELQT
ncbi:MAG: hypothetical protein WAM14_05870 [Candidatus Nitrosopolaris sp.]